MQDTSAPWLGVKKWQNGRISSNAKLELYVLLGVALVWNLFLIPLTVSLWDEIRAAVTQLSLSDRNTWDPKLLVPALLLANLSLIPTLIAQWRRWHRFGRLYMTLDPYPGAIGGQVGGYLDIPALRFHNDIPVDVRVNCVEVRITGSGKSRSRSDTVVWRKKAKAAIRWGASGARVEFVVDVDEGLPPSTLESGKHGSCYWSVRVRIPDADFDRSYEIPVFANTPRTESRLRPTGVVREETPPRVEDLPPGIATVTRTADGFRIEYPAGRSGKMGTILMLVGLFFFGAAGFLGYQFVSELHPGEGARISWFSTIILGFMTAIFGLLSTAVIAGGWFVRNNRLSVQVDREKLLSIRRAFGRDFTTAARLGEITGFNKKIGMQAGQASQAELYYRIQARRSDGRNLTVGDNIHGQEHADALLEFFRRNVPLDPAPAASVTSSGPALAIPPRLKWVLVGARVFSTLLFIGLLVALYFDMRI
ncbi:MAG TPA: hypothetical protein ENK05_13020 [Gammaproteobacteria bacterium]|nr:hypothetical protein [Gammaproteobacteria bacterium]